MAVATGFQGRTADVQVPRTGVPRIDLLGPSADAVFADAKPSSPPAKPDR